MTVNQLLHDAEHKESGAMLARRMGDTVTAEKLGKERDDLISQALAIDPERVDSAWAETNLWQPSIDRAFKAFQQQEQDDDRKNT